MSLDIKLVDCDDWEALYIGDELVEENHSLRLMNVLKHLENTHVGSVMSFEVDQEWAEANGFPRFFSAFPDEVLS